MHYVIAGSGPPVLLLHGWPETWFAWVGTIRALSERTASGYDKRTIAADLAAFIGQVAGGRAHVVAHDMGGKTAYVLARTRPELRSLRGCRGPRVLPRQR